MKTEIAFNCSRPARSSVFAFPRIWADATTSPTVSLFDMGIYSVNGLALHRIAIEYPQNSAVFNFGDPTVVTDLYFDPGTHLLLYSVDALNFGSTQQQSLSRVTTYGAYQQFSGILVPTSIQQSLNGQLQWTLQMSQIQINTNPIISTFSF